MRENVDLFLHNIVMKYTRQDKNRALNQTIDLTQRSVDASVFSNGVLDNQNERLRLMKNKLNQSVDMATVAQRKMDRKYAKYEEFKMYNRVSEKMMYNEDVFVSNVEKACDPKFSPLPPAHLIRKNEEQKLNEPQITKKEDPYSTDIVSVDLFAPFTKEIDQSDEES